MAEIPGLPSHKCLHEWKGGLYSRSWIAENIYTHIKETFAPIFQSVVCIVLTINNAYDQLEACSALKLWILENFPLKQTVQVFFNVSLLNFLTDIIKKRIALYFAFSLDKDYLDQFEQNNLDVPEGHWKFKEHNLI